MFSLPLSFQKESGSKISNALSSLSFVGPKERDKEKGLGC
jgi:hypothetical protein